MFPSPEDAIYLPAEDDTHPALGRLTEQPLARHPPPITGGGVIDVLALNVARLERGISRTMRGQCSESGSNAAPAAI